jgi:hypothetical protein
MPGAAVIVRPADQHRPKAKGGFEIIKAALSCHIQSCILPLPSIFSPHDPKPSISTQIYTMSTTNNTTTTSGQTVGEKGGNAITGIFHGKHESEARV